MCCNCSVYTISLPLQPFQKIVYTMDDRQDMLNSINHFLDETVVLPPGDWDKKNLLSMSEIQELKRKKRIRMETMEKLKSLKSLGKKKESEMKKMIEASSDKKEGDVGDGKEEEDPLKRSVFTTYPLYLLSIYLSSPLKTVSY